MMNEMSAFPESFVVISLSPDGKFELIKMPVVFDICSLEPDCSFFDCQTCHKKSTGRSSQSFHSRDRISYVLYYSDPHSKEDMCQTQFHRYGDLLLSVNCGCGYKEHHHSYRGNIYFVKHDLEKLRRERNIKHDFDKSTIVRFNTIIDCSGDDLQYIQDLLLQMKVNHEQKSCTWFEWLTSFF